jgi:ribosome-associated translation inhibitor RaiA
MQIQVHTDHNIEGTERIAAHVRGVVATALNRFGHRITRVEVHLSDPNCSKSGHEKRCVMEARIERRNPAAVTYEAATVDQAVHGAADKLKRALKSKVERLQNHH